MLCYTTAAYDQVVGPGDSSVPLLLAMFLFDIQFGLSGCGGPIGQLAAAAVAWMACCPPAAAHVLQSTTESGSRYSSGAGICILSGVLVIGSYPWCPQCLKHNLTAVAIISGQSVSFTVTRTRQMPNRRKLQDHQVQALLQCPCIRH